MLSCSAIGAPETVARSLKAFLARTGADELIITSHIFDQAARLRSYELTAALRDRIQVEYITLSPISPAR